MDRPSSRWWLRQDSEQTSVAASAGPGRRAVRWPLSDDRSPAAGTPADESHLFRCGNLSCDARRSYCETINTDVKALPSTNACRPLSVACLAQAGGRHPDCHCFDKGTRCDFCGAPSSVGPQEFYRTCFGGR